MPATCPRSSHRQYWKIVTTCGYAQTLTARFRTSLRNAARRNIAKPVCACMRHPRNTSANGGARPAAPRQNPQRRQHETKQQRKERRMAKLKLTANNVETLSAKNGRRTDYWDTVQRGLALRISPSGKKVWIAFYRTGRRFRRLTISDYPTMGLADARKRANAAMLKVADGQDPAAEKVLQRSAITFEDLAKDYVNQYARKAKRTWQEDERIL